MDNSLLNLTSNPYDEMEQQSSHERFDLRNTKYKDQIIDKLKDGTYRYETVSAFETFLLNYMSSNAFLSNQSPPKTKGFWQKQEFNQLEYARLCHEESLLLLFASIHPVDVKKDELYVIIDEVFKHTDIFTFTRTVGEDRIGVTNGIMTVKSITESKEEIKQRSEEEDLKSGGVY